MAEPHVLVNRRVYNFQEFNDEFKEETTKKQTVKQYLIEKCRCHKTCCERLSSFFPLFAVLRSYNCTDVLADLIAGITMAVFHIPQGLAYGMLAGVDPVNGLYTSFIPAFIFAFLSTSRQLSVGTFSLMCIMLSDFLDKQYDGYMSYMLSSNRTFPIKSNYIGTQPADDSPEASYVQLQLIIMATFICALINLSLGFLKLGVAVRFMSTSMVRGFTLGAAFHVVTAQIPLLLGVYPAKSTSMFTLAGAYYEIFLVIAKTNWPTVVTSIICMIVLYVGKEFISPPLLKKCRVPIPIELLIIAGGLMFSYFAKAEVNFGIAVVGTIPQGLPKPMIPDFNYMPRIIFDSIPLAIVGATVTMSIAKTYALQYDYKVDYNQELIALGFSNLLGSFCQAFYAVGALARSSVVATVGMKSQLATLISCCCMLLVVMFLGPIFESVPKCVLGAIIVVSLKSLFMYVKELPTLWKLSKMDFAIWVVTCLTVTIFDITPGLIAGFVLTIFSAVLRTQNSDFAILGRVEGTEMFEDITAYQSAKEIEGIKIIRYEGPIGFSNSEMFKDVVLRTVFGHLKRYPDQPLRTVILDGSSWNYLDSSGLKAMSETLKTLKKHHLHLLLSCVRKNVIARFFTTSLFKEFSPNIFFPTTEDAVLYALSNIELEPIENDLLNSLKVSFHDEKKPLLEGGAGKRYT